MIEAPREIFDWLMEILVPTWSWHSGGNQRIFSFEFHNQTQSSINEYLAYFKVPNK